MELSKFLAVYYGATWRDGDGLDFTTLDEHTLEDVCNAYVLCMKDKAYLQRLVADAKRKGLISIDTTVE